MKNLKIFLLAISVLFPTLNQDYNALKIEQSLEGKVIDKDTKEALLFASVALYKNGNLITGTQTDLDGNYKFSNIDAGTYDVEVSYVGYQSARVAGIQVFAGKANKVDIEIGVGGSTLIDEIVVKAFKVPLVEQDITTQGGIVTAETIRNLPNKNINALAGKVAGVIPAEGGYIKIRGSRSNATNYYIDGIRVPGTTGITAHPHGQHKDQTIDWNTEDYDLIQENVFMTPDVDPLSTFSVDVDASSYSNMRRYLDYGNQPPKDAIRIEELVNYFDYAYEQPRDKHPFSITSELADCPWQKDHKLLHIGLQGKDIDAADLPPSNLVFLIDVSGSMSAYNKLPLVKQSFKILLEKLRPQDRVAMVVYAGASGVVLNSISGDKKHEITKALENLQAGGGTSGAKGIQLAYQIANENFIKEGNNRVILATDGDFNIGVSSDSELTRIIEKERELGTFLTVLGFGMGNYKDNKMQKLADHGNGNHAYIDNISEARKVFVNEFGGTLFTIAKDVKIQVEFNPANVKAYRLIGYENRMLETQDFNDDKKDAGEIGAGHTVTALYEIIPTGVESEFVKSVDELKYQKGKKLAKVNQQNDEWMHIKFRYKKPDGNKSQLIDHVVSKGQLTKKPSNDFNWSAAVASFGMILRESEFVGNSDYRLVLNLANQSKGKDTYGYRGEFISMIENMRTIAGE